MKLSFFIKSWSRDFPWLEYLKQSVRKFAPDAFHEIVLLLPEGETFDWPEAKIHQIKEEPPGYMFQMSCKCHADKLCEGDVIVFGDSDTIFTRKVTADDFIKDGKPIWIIAPMSEAREDQKSTWIRPMSEFVGKPPTIEAMRRHCFVWPRAFFDKLRAFCRYRHGMELSDYIMSRAVPGSPLALNWSEFNCAGWMAHEFEHDLFTWISESDAGQSYTFQSYTHGGTERVKQDFAVFEGILNPQPLTKEKLVEIHDELAKAESEPMFTHFRELTIEDHISALVDECNRGFGQKGAVVRKLIKAGILNPKTRGKRKKVTS